MLVDKCGRKSTCTKEICSHVSATHRQNWRCLTCFQVTLDLCTMSLFNVLYSYWAVCLSRVTNSRILADSCCYLSVQHDMCICAVWEGLAAVLAALLKDYECPTVEIFMHM